MPRPPLRCRPTVTPLEDRLAPAAGDFDPTFGSGGVAALPEEPRIDDIDVLPDGRVVALGRGRTEPFRPVVHRLLADGRPDPTFAVPDGALQVSDVFSTVAALPDGRALLVGRVTSPATNSDWLIVRLAADGRPDPTFGTAGRVVLGFDGAGVTADHASAVAPLPDGRVVVAGASGPPQPSPSTLTYQADQGSKFAAARLTADGALDPTFGDGGRVRVSFPIAGVDAVNGGVVQFDDSGAAAAAVQPDGRVILAGHAVKHVRISGIGRLAGLSTRSDAAAVRLTPDGALDPTFGDGGRVRPLPTEDVTDDNSLSSVGVRPDGRIVLTTLDTATRLTADGRTDPTYGEGGYARFGPTLPDPHVAADGSVVVAGSETTRLAADGRPDATFGGDGRVIAEELGSAAANTLPVPVTIPRFVLLTAATQPDGAVLLAGYVADGITPTDAGDRIVRLLGAGPVGFAAAAAGAVQAGGSADAGTVTLNPRGGSLAPAGRQTYFPNFLGVVRTATADVTGDGVPDFVGGAGPGGGPNVVVFDGQTGARVADFFAFEPAFVGGVFVAAADLDGDGKAEVVVTPDQGGGPVVAVFGGAGLAAGGNDGSQLTRFFGIEDPNFRGGARPAAGDITGDGKADLVVSAGFLGGPRVAIFDGAGVAAGGAAPPKLVSDFFAFEDTLRNGAFVAVGDVNGDGMAEVAFGGGPGGAPRVRVYGSLIPLLQFGSRTHLDGVPPPPDVDPMFLKNTGWFRYGLEDPLPSLADFFAGDAALRGGVRVALRDTNGDGLADLITGSGDGEPGRVRVYLAGHLRENRSPTADQELDPFGGQALANGVFVG